MITFLLFLFFLFLLLIGIPVAFSLAIAGGVGMIFTLGIDKLLVSLFKGKDSFLPRLQWQEKMPRESR